MVNKWEVRLYTSLFLAGLDFYLALLFFWKGSITFGSVLFSYSSNKQFKGLNSDSTAGISISAFLFYLCFQMLALKGWVFHGSFKRFIGLLDGAAFLGQPLVF